MSQPLDLDRAAWLLECYADFIRSDVMSVDIERHPYLPDIEATAAELRAVKLIGWADPSKLKELESCNGMGVWMESKTAWERFDQPQQNAAGFVPVYS